MSKENTINYGYSNEKDEQELSEMAAANNAEARRKGIFLGKQNLPPLAEQSFDSHIAPFKANYGKYRAKRIGIIKPEVHETRFNRFCTVKTKREEEINAEIKNLKHENDLDRHNLEGKVKPEEKKRNPIFIVLLGIMYLTEFFLNALAFEFLGGNPILAYCIGAGVTTLAGTLCFGIGKSLIRMETEGRKIYLQLGLQVAAALGLVVAMSVIRTQMLSDTEVPISPWIFFFINVAFLIGTVFFSRLFFPSQKETDESKELSKRFEAIEKREAEIRHLENEIKMFGEQYKEEEEKYLVIMSEVKNLCKRVDAHYRETVALFKAENLIARPDKGTPVSFLAPITELSNTQES
jgi:hypothetical protein